LIGRRSSIRRRLAILTRLARDKVRRRLRLREYAGAWSAIRAALAAAEIDPAGLKILWPLSGAERELARLGERPALRDADAAFAARDPALAARHAFAAAPDRIARFADPSPPDPGAALLDWYAWSLARLAY
jgi:hypothetical protein